MGMAFYDGYKLVGLETDWRDRLCGIKILDCNIEAQGELHHIKCNSLTNPRDCFASCRVLITADQTNVDPFIFETINNNGLVYDGRLIVDENFRTVDPAIYAGGSLCEFSRVSWSEFMIKENKWNRNWRQLLRHDGYNGNEVGKRLAEWVMRNFKRVDQEGVGGDEEDINEHVTKFEIAGLSKPIVKQALLPGNLTYCQVESCGKVSRENWTEVCTDTLDLSDPSEFKGSYCRLTLNADSKVIMSFLYIGSASLYPSSLFSIVGKSISYLNKLEARVTETCVTDIVDFLNDSWSASYFHDEFFPSLIESLKADPSLVEKAKAADNTLEQEIDLYLLSFLQDAREMSKIFHYYLPEDVVAGGSAGA